MSRKVKSGKVNLNFVITGIVKVASFPRVFSFQSHLQNKTKKTLSPTSSHMKHILVAPLSGCHIRTLTIHLENGLNRLRDST